MRDYSGQVFGRLTVIKAYRDVSGTYRADCVCACGALKAPQIGALLSGATQSCGCFLRERARENHLKHGLAPHGRKAPEYAIWCTMKARCYNPNQKEHKYYGARGIKVCERWRTSFANFIQDMGRRPDPKLQLDRANNDGDYEPANCRWVTKSEQMKNRRPFLRGPSRARRTEIANADEKES